MPFLIHVVGMTTFEIVVHILSLLITFIATAGCIVYLIKGLIITNKKDFIKMLTFMIVAVVTIIFEWFLIF